MIDEKKLISEIESYKSAAEHFLKYKDNLEHWRTQKDLCDKFLSIINSMQKEPISKDLEELTVSKWRKEQDTKLPCIHQRDTLDEYAYQVAYDLSNDWIKETPDWNDVEIACKLGANWYHNFNSKKDE